MAHVLKFEIGSPAWACEEVTSDLELGGGFAGYSGFLHYLELASHELDTIGINVTKNEIQIEIGIGYLYATDMNSLTKRGAVISVRPNV